MHHLDSLLTCPLGAPLKVTRVADQDPAFLRFIESNNLKPGQPIEVERRDAAADAVTLRGKNGQPIVIGTRAASKLLVEVLGLLAAMLLLFGEQAFAQSAGPPSAGVSFGISDSSFLVEDPFNQTRIQPSIFGSKP
jgi:hypothetical protein